MQCNTCINYSMLSRRTYVGENVYSIAIYGAKVLNVHNRSRVECLPFSQYFLFDGGAIYYIQKEGRNWFLRRFQQLRSYRDEMKPGPR